MRGDSNTIDACVAPIGGTCIALTPSNRGLAVALASAPEQVRGFDLVQETQLAAAQEKQRELLMGLRATAKS